MKRRSTLLAAAAAVVLAAGCGGSSSSSSSSNSGSQSHTPVTLTVWHLYTGAEGQAFKDGLKGFEKQYPWIHLKLVVQPNTTNDTFDPNLIQAIHGGNAPDVAISFAPSYDAQWCSSGLWLNLTPFMQQSGVSASDFAPATAQYTSFAGKQCALPSLTDATALYYNTDMFRKAGIAGPPKTLSELEADAKRLTVKNPDGTIKVAGFVPLDQFNELDISNIATAYGAKWFDSSGKAVLASDPAWAAAFNWQKQFVDWYGYSTIEKFYATYANTEFTPNNAFETGKVAMMYDGEWRTAFIRREHPELHYATAPFPVADSQPQLYGQGLVGGTVVGIPQTTKHPQEAWDLVRYLSTNTGYLVKLANALGNVPTTSASQASPQLNLGPQFQTFIDVWKNPHSSFYPPLTTSGAGWVQLIDNFDTKWQAGNVSDLASGLQALDTNIDNQLQQGQTP